MSFSIRTRLLVAVSVLAVTAVAAVALTARQSTRVEFRKFQDLEMRAGTRAPAAKEIWSELGKRCCRPEDIAAAAAHLRAPDLLIVTDTAGAYVGAAGGRAGEVISAAESDGTLLISLRRGGRDESMQLQYRGQERHEVPAHDGTTMVAHVVTLPDGSGMPPAARFLVSVDLRLFWTTVAIALAAIAVTWVMTRRLVAPIAALQHAARDLARGDFTRRVDVRGGDEIAALGRRFNEMASELERQHALRRALVHDVAHELRTPLTALQCRLESVMDGLARDPHASAAAAHEEVRHLSRLVDDLQELALAEARELRLCREPVSVAEVIASAVRAVGLDDDPRLSVAVPETMSADADAMRLRQVCVNLLSNAARHTPADGRIDVSASTAEQTTTVTVRNTGSALSADELPRVFDRFYRADPSRQRETGGSGLGLAIVKHLVEAQGGSVRAESDGQSVTFALTLPSMAGPARTSD